METENDWSNIVVQPATCKPAFYGDQRLNSNNSGNLALSYIIATYAAHLLLEVLQLLMVAQQILRHRLCKAANRKPDSDCPKDPPQLLSRLSAGRPATPSLGSLWALSSRNHQRLAASKARTARTGNKIAKRQNTSHTSCTVDQLVHLIVDLGF